MDVRSHPDIAPVLHISEEHPAFVIWIIDLKIIEQIPRIIGVVLQSHVDLSTDKMRLVLCPLLADP